jgi:hypothetical protein
MNDWFSISRVNPSTRFPPSGFGRSRTSLHGQPQSADVGVESRPHVLEVEGQDVQLGQHLRRGLERVAVEGVDDEPGDGVRLGGDHGAGVLAPADPVLRREEPLELHALRLVEQVGQVALAHHGRMVGDEPHALALQRLEPAVDEDLGACSQRGRGGGGGVGGAGG